MDGIGNSLIVPRGVPNLEPSVYDMTEIYKAEDRLHEIAFVRPDSAIELMGYFNHITNETTKYLSWIEYELLQAEKYLSIAKATVILDVMPEKLKALGVKSSESVRDALIVRDADCAKRQDTLDQLKAVKALLESKVKSFTRAYYACQTVIERRSSSAASPQVNGFQGMTYDVKQQNYMGNTDGGFEAMKKARRTNGE